MWKWRMANEHGAREQKKETHFYSVIRVKFCFRFFLSSLPAQDSHATAEMCCMHSQLDRNECQHETERKKKKSLK